MKVFLLMIMTFPDDNDSDEDVWLVDSVYAKKEDAEAALKKRKLEDVDDDTFMGDEYYSIDEYEVR